MSFERIVRFEPAFDRRDPDPSKNYGIHGVTLRMVLKGDKGATQFVLYTNWQLPHVTKETLEQRVRDAMSLKVRFLPLPADLGYHSPKPMYDGDQPQTDDCEFLGGPCYYDGSGLAADNVYKALLEGGSDAVWKILEDYYTDLFEETS